MLPQPPYLQFQNNIYTHPLLYGEYINQTLYLLHPQKKIALNIPPEKLNTFVQEIYSNLQKHLKKDFQLFQINSFELIAKQNNFKVKKRKNLLPESILFLPSQTNSDQTLQSNESVKLTPLNSPIFFDYPKPDKTKFINQLQHLQKKLTKKKLNINFSYISHSKQDDQKILTSKNYSNPLLFKSPDFTILADLKNHSQIQTDQNILFTENHPRNFQKGQLTIYTKNQKNDYSIDQSTNIIQTNIQNNLTLQINNQTKAFQIYKKLSKAINQSQDD
jgi:hypothetical protein